MRAAEVHRYGPPECLTIADRPRPEPGRGEVRIRVEAAAVTAGDARLRSGHFPPGFAVLARLAIGIRGPRARVPGAVFSGVVDAVGPGASGTSGTSGTTTTWQPGDEVAGMTGMRLGAHAEYAVVRASALARKPAAVSHVDAAAVLFGGVTALNFLRDRVGIGAGDTVLVNGASGAVGTSAVQLATHLGGIVTAVTSAANRPLAHRLGAQQIVDYRETPVTQLGERFDVVLDAVGNLTRESGLRLIHPDGALILAVAGLGDTIRARGRVIAGPSPERPADMEYVLGMLAAGELDPIAEVVGGLDALVDAHRRIDSGHKVGNLVILPGLGRA